jgi:hypothetical protein
MEKLGWGKKGFKYTGVFPSVKAAKSSRGKCIPGGAVKDPVRFTSSFENYTKSRVPPTTASDLLNPIIEKYF